jgi:hypothetical protein
VDQAPADPADAERVHERLKAKGLAKLAPPAPADPAGQAADPNAGQTGAAED